MNLPSNILNTASPSATCSDGGFCMPQDTFRHGTVYVFFGKQRARQRKPRWFIMIEFCDRTYEYEVGPADWKAAASLAMCRAMKYGFRVSDYGDTELCGYAKSKGLRS